MYAYMYVYIYTYMCIYTHIYNQIFVAMISKLISNLNNPKYIYICDVTLEAISRQKKAHTSSS